MRTDLMGSVLDELLTERPLALLVLVFDGVAIVAVLLLLMRMVYLVLHAGPLDATEEKIIAAVAAGNAFFLVSEVRNSLARRRLGLSMKLADVIDYVTAAAVFATCGMASQERLRLQDVFLVVASVACGLSWLKLLGYIAGLKRSFALYIQALVSITASLRSFIVLLAIVLGMFGSMFYIVNMTPRRASRGGLTDDLTDDGPFARVDESFLSLFQMILGQFDRDWFEVPHSVGLSTYAVALFVAYMGVVFVVMFNVLIAVVCDNYDYAMSNALELFLRSRLALLAGLELQGYTRSSTGCVVGPLVRALQGTAGHNRIKRWFAVHAEWVRADDRAAQWDRTAHEGAEDEWAGRVKHVERLVTRVVGARLAETEARLAATEGALLRALERIEAQHAQQAPAAPRG